MKNICKQLSALSLIAIFSLSSLTAQAADEKKYKWKLAASWSNTLVPFIDAPKDLARQVEKMSNGRLTIEIHDANKTKSAFGVFDFVKSGQYEMGHTASYYYKGKDIDLLTATTMPFGLLPLEQYGWYYYGGGDKLLNEVFSKHHILAFPGGNSGVQMGGWFKKEIKTLKDLEGLKIRYPGFAGEILAKAGAVVTVIPAGELYTALERNTIDGLEWVSPSMDIDLGFQKVANYYYTGWHEPATELSFFINERAYNKLPADLQEILRVAMRTSAYDMYVKNAYLNAIAWDKIKKEYPNVQVRIWSPEIMAGLRKINAELVNEAKAKSPLFKKIIESQEDYLVKARRWTIISDYLYTKDNLVDDSAITIK